MVVQSALCRSRSEIPKTGFLTTRLINDINLSFVGLGMSLFYLCGFVAISWMFGSSSGAPLVFVTLGASTGQLLCPYLFEILLSEFGWRGTYFIIGALALNGLLPAIILHTSRKFYQTETSSKAKASNNVFDVTLLRDPMITTFLFNCFILDMTGKLFEVSYNFVCTKSNSDFVPFLTTNNYV